MGDLGSCIRDAAAAADAGKSRKVDGTKRVVAIQRSELAEIPPPFIYMIIDSYPNRSVMQHGFSTRINGHPAIRLEWMHTPYTSFLSNRDSYKSTVNGRNPPGQWTCLFRNTKSFRWSSRDRHTSSVGHPGGPRSPPCKNPKYPGRW